MGNQSVISIEAVIDYIESHLDGKLELETVAEAVHYSKYHLHRLFTETVGMTIHDYVQRRQLTEAAKLLVFSDKPIIEIAFICGYESQQSFSLAFKAMYKSPPAEYREERSFYPLQLRFILHRRTTAMEFTIQDIRLAEKKDIVDWMNLMRLVIDGYPVMDEDDYLAKLEESIDEKRALVLREGDILIGAMAFTYSPGSIEFLGVHPQYRNRGLQKLFLDIMLPGKDGFALMEDFKKKELPVLYLTAKDDVASKVKGLKLGAEDYMVKPFEMLELLVRIEKVLERTGRAKKVLTVRNILVDMQSHQVYKDGLPVSLKPMEYDLFVLLLQNKNIALGREELLKRVWGENYLGESRTVDVHIGQLRKKLELYDEIRTIPKLGYRLEE